MSKSVVISHRKFDNALTTLRRFMTPTEIIGPVVLVGPAGAGKTTVAKLLFKQLLDDFAQHISENPADIPVFWSEVPDASGGEVNWTHFYQNCLAGLGDALWSANISAPADGSQAIRSSIDLADELILGDRSSHLRYRLDRYIKKRNVSYFFLDEVVHFTESRSDTLLYANALKSMANRLRVRMLLIGAYGAEAIATQNGQLSRRNKVVHLGRYKDTPEDRADFDDFIFELQENLPFSEAVDLEPYRDVIFNRCLGLSGLASQALKQSVFHAAYDNEPWSEKYLFEAFLPKAHYNANADEIEEGEDRLKDYLPSFESFKIAPLHEVNANPRSNRARSIK